MPLIPFPVDTTPLVAPPTVGMALTHTGGVGQAPPRSTESGTDVLARKLALAVMPVWMPVTLGDYLDRATGTVTYDTATLPVRSAESETGHATPQHTAPASGPGARAYAAFKDLGRWLMVEDPAVARMVGIRRTTPYAWDRDGTTPRPKTVRRLMQHHAVVAAVVDRLGEDDGRTWLAAGSPSAIELLLDGRLDVVDERVGELVFARSAPSPSARGYLPEDDDDLPPSRIAARRG